MFRILAQSRFLDPLSSTKGLKCPVATLAYQERSTSWSQEGIQCAIGTIDDSDFTRERIRNFNES